MKSRYAAAVLYVFIFFSMGTNSMASDFEFNEYINGSPNNVTLSELSVKNDSFTLIFRGNSMNTSTPGIGVFNGRTSELNLNTIKELRDQKVNNALTSIDRISKPLQQLIEVSDKITKLDVTTNLTLEGDQLLVDVFFTNSGKTSIAFPSPKNWGGRYNPITQESWIRVSVSQADNPKAEDPAKYFRFWLGGNQLLNKDDFKGDVIRLSPGQTCHAKFMAWPSNAFSKGRYDLSSVISLQYISAPDALKGYVEFGGHTGSAVFDHDYPSTPEEIKSFEAHQVAIKRRAN